MTIRPSAWVLQVWGTAVLFALVVFIVFRLIRDQGSGGWLGSVLVLTLWLLALRNALSRVDATLEGVVVVNPFSTRELSWSEIGRFALGGSVLWGTQGYVELTQGERVVMWAVQGRGSEGSTRSKRARAAIESLEGLRLVAQSTE